MIWDERASTQSTNLDGAGKCVNLSLEGPHTSTHTCHSPYFARLHSSSFSLEATHKNQSLDVKDVHLAPNFRQTETTRTAPFRGSLPSMLCYHSAFYMPCEGTNFLRFSLHGPHVVVINEGSGNPLPLCDLPLLVVPIANPV